ncbi:hypothetical protein HanIR_Chr14g0713881 [Helianthus annuus]|nr:hypothetical protein HanIR_Chr14g0713881 [Helianthus annuus]
MLCGFYMLYRVQVHILLPLPYFFLSRLHNNTLLFNPSSSVDLPLPSTTLRVLLFC